MPSAEKVTKESFRTELEQLVANFAANEDELTSPGYTEMQCRTQFITPLFRALGWDVENRAGKTSKEMDVWEEKGPSEGNPDYTFRLGATAKFFVEAKAPHEHLESERHVLQVKRYAWSSKEVFAAILTDFEEFRFYDASQEPDPDHPHRGLLLDLTYKQFLANLDRLWDFSRQRVAEGSLEALLPRDKRSLQFRKPPDEKFLQDMTRWREELARAVHKRSPKLPAETLTEVVQRLLDRLIFIRVAEDRRILEKNSLLDCALDWEAVGGRKPLLPRLNDLFHEINEDFNGEIFKFHPCEGIALDDPVLHRIIKELYPPKSPYRFDVIPVDIFGAVYERYLGKTIYVKGKKVDVDVKPETRKAGGVYYTPKYIVDYIVKHTVGQLIEGKSPKEIEKIRILDPACGSGSFLLGAFQCLIDYHTDWYEKHKKEATAHPLYPELLRDENGVPRLSIHRKARILRNNLFGVDLDPQAVEITMMNLYLKALEGERDLPHKQHLLPELAGNIRCGNSLIAPDIAQESNPSPQTPSPVAPATGKRRLPSSLSPEDLARLRPFDWSAEFPEIMKTEASPHSGFDAVIGNPPYVTTLSTAERRYFFPRSITRGRELDTFYLFVEKGMTLLRQRGRLGMILPNVFLLQYGAENLRKFLLNYRINRICDLGFTVFEQAVVPSAVLVVENQPPNGNKLSFSESTSQDTPVKQVKQALFAQLPFAQFNAKLNPRMLRILRKIEENALPLTSFVEIHEGVHSGNIRHKLFFRKRQGRNPKRMLKGSDINRYFLRWDGWWVNYDPKVVNRTRGEYASLREEAIFRGPKIFSRQTADRIIATIDSNHFYSDNTLHSTKLLPASPDLPPVFGPAIM